MSSVCFTMKNACYFIGTIAYSDMTTTVSAICWNGLSNNANSIWDQKWTGYNHQRPIWKAQLSHQLNACQLVQQFWYLSCALAVCMKHDSSNNMAWWWREPTVVRTRNHPKCIMGWMDLVGRIMWKHIFQHIGMLGSWHWSHNLIQ